MRLRRRHSGVILAKTCRAMDLHQGNDSSFSLSYLDFVVAILQICQNFCSLLSCIFYSYLEINQHYQWFFWCNLPITSLVMLPVIIPILTFIWLVRCCHLDSATQHICSFDSESLFSMAASSNLIFSLQRKATREF